MMTAQQSPAFIARRSTEDDRSYPVVLPTRFTIRKDYAVTFKTEGDFDFDPERDTPGEQEYVSWGVWDEVMQDWAGKNGDASHFDTYGEAVGWFDSFLQQHAVAGTLSSLLLAKTIKE
jgi:hypothetical protein